jgi:hypothetical protein
MLRINLLPPYIYEGAKRRNVMIIWFLILALVIGGVIFAKTQIDNETTKAKDEAARLEPKAKQADDMQAKANSINTDSQTIRDKATFVNNARKADTETYQEVVKNVRMYTWPRVLYDGMNPSGSTVTIGAYAPSLTDVGRYMIWMEKNPKIGRVDVVMNSIPSFPAGAVQQQGGNQQQAGGLRPPGGGGHNFQVALSLLKPIEPGPTYGGAGGAPAGPGGGMPGAGGGGGMMSGGGSGGMMSGGMGGPAAGGKGGLAN